MISTGTRTFWNMLSALLVSLTAQHASFTPVLAIDDDGQPTNRILQFPRCPSTL
jgi:hypothetical protein